MNIPPEIDLFRRAEAAGFEVLFVARLTVIKFPALYRQNAYRDRPCHEQAAWLELINSEPDFEPTYLARMIRNDEVVRALPARKLVRILVEELKTRLAWRLTRRSGHRAIFWTGKGAGMELQKKYKGLN